jgi:hypothetical protein
MGTRLGDSLVKPGDMVRFTTVKHNHLTGIILEVVVEEFPGRYRILTSLGRVETWLGFNFVVIS